ncbi:transcriptional regulator PpsR [Cypionkella sinensis]|uniref:Transcriptional regulator PpsR n=1 Tax=Cypionkella sinensis TaxID=1756043 RepID=A0ABV7J0Q5_9RHOB
MTMPLIDPEMLSEIVSTAADISLLISGEARVVAVMVNPGHLAFGRLDSWVGKPVSEIVTDESYEKLVKRLAVISKQGSRALAVEVNHIDQSLWEFPVRYSMHNIGKDKTILMMGRDMRPVAEMQQQLVMAQFALERDYETQREMDTRYRVLMEATRDAVVLVAMNSGRISDLNAAAALMLGGSRQDLVGAAIAQEFEGRRRGEFLESLSNIASADAVSPVELVARRSQRKVRVIPKLFRAAGERLMLCRIEAPDQATAPGSEANENLERLFHEGVDGMVFLDQDGVITAANDAFLKMADSTHLASVRGRSMGDFLARGGVDLRVLLDNARRARQLRMYATRILSEFKGEIAVEISATFLSDRPHSGFGLIIRDASRAEMLRKPGSTAGEDGMRSVMELVGSSTLKDIVSETTDVVEKMCIQTAVDLTRNNRVAAAEMLGLSRQSLYVKLRKFGLLSKDDE